VRLASPQRSLHKLYLSLGRVAARLVGRESAWDSVTMPVPASAFGPGSRRPFADYFIGDSSVVVRSIDDIVAWLETCEYATDADLFHEPDVWQHPVTFERRRRGDCEDFALWAWRKLADIGVDAELCVGRIVCGGDTPQVNRQHAWVVFRIDDTAFLFEPALRIRSQMIRPLEEVIDDYVPHFAVDHRFATRAFAGCASDSRRSRATSSAPVGAI
jgi:hypothetical protein